MGVAASGYAGGMKALALVLLLAGPAAAQSSKRAVGGENCGENLTLAFSIKSGPLTAASRITLAAGCQANWALGGETAKLIRNNQGMGAEYKKKAAIVNCVFGGVEKNA